MARTFFTGQSTNPCIPIGATVGYVQVDQGAGAPKISVFIAKSWTISAGADVTFTDTGAVAVALVAYDTIDVEGTLDNTNNGYTFATSPAASCSSTGTSGAARRRRRRRGADPRQLDERRGRTSAAPARPR